MDSRPGNRRPPYFGYNSTTAKVAELVDALDLGSSAERHVGSTPSFRTRSRPIETGVRDQFFAARKLVSDTSFRIQQGKWQCSRQSRTQRAPSSATSR